MAPYKGLQDTLYKEMLGRIKETDLSRPGARGRLLLLHADRAGAAVHDLLPQEGQPRRARGGLPRRQRAGEGRGVHGHRRHERQRRRQPARVHDRHHRLPRVQALRARPAHGRAARSSRPRRSRRSTGRRTTRRCSTRRRTPPSGRIASIATRSARTAAARCSTRRRTSASASASAGRAARPSCSSRSAA